MVRWMAQDDRRTFADRLNFLFETVRPQGETREYTNSEVAAATDISGSYVGYLRKGIRDNPSVETVQALARFFGVRPSYFVDDERDTEHAVAVEAQLRLLQALNDPGIKRLAMRAAEAELSPAALDAVTAMIDQVQRLEQAASPKSRRRGQEQSQD
jgi:transcriptional regulator with XRE-family HTH domain